MVTSRATRKDSARGEPGHRWTPSSKLLWRLGLEVDPQLVRIWEGEGVAVDRCEAHEDPLAISSGTPASSVSRVIVRAGPWVGMT